MNRILRSSSTDLLTASPVSDVASLPRGAQGDIRASSNALLCEIHGTEGMEERRIHAGARPRWIPTCFGICLVTVDGKATTAGDIATECRFIDLEGPTWPGYPGQGVEFDRETDWPRCYVARFN